MTEHSCGLLLAKKLFDACLVGCPHPMRSDYGTENCYLVATQIALHTDHTHTYPGTKPYRYGKSTTDTVSEFECKYFYT